MHAALQQFSVLYPVRCTRSDQTAKIGGPLGAFTRNHRTIGFLDAFNPSFRYPVALASGQVMEGRGWFVTGHIGIDQGSILAGIANHRTGLIWNIMKKNPYLRRGLTRAGFRGGWLDADPAQ